MQLQVEQVKAQAMMAKAESDMKVAELRVQADQARTQFEVEKGLNKQEDDIDKAAEGEEEEDTVTKEEVERLVEAAVKRAIAQQNAANR